VGSALSIGTVKAKVLLDSHTGQHSACTQQGGPRVLPPAGFNPLTASNEQLACYGLPPRPSGGEAL